MRVFAMLQDNLIEVPRIDPLPGDTEHCNDKIEELRQILSRQQLRNVSYVEAEETGESLIEFYHALAEDTSDDHTA